MPKVNVEYTITGSYQVDLEDDLDINPEGLDDDELQDEANEVINGDPFVGVELANSRIKNVVTLVK